MRADQLVDYVANFQRRLLQDALAEATADYWNRRAHTFDAVGDYGDAREAAQACRNRARVALADRWYDDLQCCSTTPEQRLEIERLHRAFEAVESSLGVVA